MRVGKIIEAKDGIKWLIASKVGDDFIIVRIDTGMERVTKEDLETHYTLVNDKNT